MFRHVAGTAFAAKGCRRCGNCYESRGLFFTVINFFFYTSEIN